MARIPVPVGTYNSQTLPLGDADLAADNYIGDQDVVRYFERIWANRTNKAGGSKQIFDKFVDWASPEKVEQRGGSPTDLQWRLIQDAIRTGKVDPRINRETLRRGLGVGLSETARAQQHKEGFLDSFIGKILITAAQVGAGFIPGVGPYVAAGIGAAAGAANGGGVFGGLMGAVTGYGAGRLGATLGSEFVAAGGWAELAANPEVFFKTMGYNLTGDALAAVRSVGFTTAVTAAAGAVAAAQAGKIPKPTSGNGPGALLNDPAGTSLESDQDRLERERARTTAAANYEESRTARRQSLLAVGAHTGRGDPNRIASAAPRARGLSALPVPTQGPKAIPMQAAA